MYISGQVMTNRGHYQLEIREDRLILRTSTFRPLVQSILHSGIYNREMASLLIASLTGGGGYVLLSFMDFDKVILFVVSLFIFAMTFLFFRTVVLKEPYLEAIFDRKGGSVSLIIKEPFRSLRDNFPITSVSDVAVNHREVEPVNPDGVDVVERIALRHGTVIPGLGAKRDIYSVELAMKDKGKRGVTLLTTGRKEIAEEVMRRIKEFIWRDDDYSIR